MVCPDDLHLAKGSELKKEIVLMDLRYMKKKVLKMLYLQ